MIDLQWFAAEDEGRTEEPSEYKLRKAREEGRVAKSQELNGIVVYLFAIVVLIIAAPWMERKFREILLFYFTRASSDNVSGAALYMIFFRYLLMMVLPISIAGIVAGVAVNLVQNKGFLFTTKTIEPKFSKIVPKFGEYFKKTLFSREGLFNVAKSILKVALIAVIAWTMIRSDLDDTLAMLRTGGPELALRQIGSMTAKLLVVTALVLLAIGIVDYVVQRRQFLESMKMSKQEVKQEFKEMEGDPEVKSHLETAQRDMLKQSMPRAVKEADVVITNPTHYAVSLQWVRENSDAPQVTAKGEDLTAMRMKKIAAENDVPVVENRPLARGLYTDTEVGDIIPQDYLRAIATVYAQIGYMDRNQNKK